MNTLLLKHLFLLFVLGTLLATLNGCAFFQPEFEAPLVPFETMPQTTGEMKEHMERFTQPVENLVARLRVTASGEGVTGRQRLGVYILYEVPANISVRGDHPRAGEVFRLTQIDDVIAVYLPQEATFYRGPVRVLDAYPGAFFGVRPVDMAQALLINQYVLNLLLEVPDNTLLPESLPGLEHWTLATERGENRRESFAVRQKDGLVERVAVYNAQNQPKVLVTYYSYDWFGDWLWPSHCRFDFPEAGLRLDARLERLVRVNKPLSRGALSLTPPPGSGIAVQPIEAWVRGGARNQQDQP